jgi:hypothetical protein
MKTITILGALTMSALFATAAGAQVITIYPSTATPVAQTAPGPAVTIPQVTALPVTKLAAAAPGATQPAPVQAAQPIQMLATGQPITISVEPAAAQPSAVPSLAALATVMPQTYQPFPPDTQRAVNCLIATGGNYVTCGINEALNHVYAEVAKCVIGVNVINGCFAPKAVAKAGRPRRS